MIYARPDDGSPLDQGDLIIDCPILAVVQFDPSTSTPPETGWSRARVVVLTQTCDLAQGKTANAIVAIAYPATDMVQRKILKAADIQGPVRGGRLYGYYFLPAEPAYEIPELVVDLRQIHTLSLETLQSLCRIGKRQARIQPLFREHLAKHFADTYSRIGLPEPYRTE